LRAWERDPSPDLSGTMAALDRALGRAEKFGQWLEGGSTRDPKPFPEDPMHGQAPPPEPPPSDAEGAL
jgi:hypothetical protein